MKAVEAHLHLALLCILLTPTVGVSAPDFEASAERIQLDLNALCAHGPRVVGSVGLENALTYAETELRRAGLSPVCEGVELDIWDAGRTPVRLRGPRGSSPVFDLTALGRSPALLPGRFELLDLDWGMPGDLDEQALRIPGRIVLIQEGCPEGARSIHRIEKLFRASEAGATAVIFHHPTEMAFRGTVAWPGEARIAAMNLEDGQGLRESLAAGQRLELEVLREGAIPPAALRGESTNLIAERSGRYDLEGPLLLSAHLDAWDLGEGALDDAAGIAVVLEVARLLSEQAWSGRRSYRIALFTGEELGLQGSQFHLAQCEAGRASLPALVLNLEMPEAPSGFVVHSGKGLRSLLAPLLLTHRDLGLASGVVESLDLYGDQLPFLLAGIPSLTLSYHRSEDADRRAHTAADRLEALDPEALALSAELLAATIWTLSDPLAPLPTRLDEDALDAHFAAHGRVLERVRTRGY